MTTKVLVTGGREYKNDKQVDRTLSRLLEQFPDMEIVVGDAKGADTLAFLWAKKNQVNVHFYPAKWAKYDKSAGPHRNQEMLSQENPKMGVAFPGGKGTYDMVTRLRGAKVPVFQVLDNTEEPDVE